MPITDKSKNIKNSFACEQRSFSLCGMFLCCRRGKRPCLAMHSEQQRSEITALFVLLDSNQKDFVYAVFCFGIGYDTLCRRKNPHHRKIVPVFQLSDF
jgi:hypothetical protein